MTIIDAHCHSGVAGVLVPHGTPDHSLARYTRRAARAGIRSSVLMAPPGGVYREANRRVAALVRGDPSRWLGFVFVSPVADRGHVAMVVDEALHWGACGIKVHWSDGVITPEVGKVAEYRRLPVLYDPCGDLDAVRRAVRSFPDVAWIVPHLSSFADDPRAQAGLIDALERSPNLFTDTAGVRYFDLLSDAVRRAGPHKVLFGSDGPFLHPGVELAKVDALHLDPAATALIVGGNIQRLTRYSRGRSEVEMRRQR
ncbi:amidohydrolase family protein [Prescottella agglutinans]|uniref:amidohydrolase family protein n=1 Tax=Prescottella agglutinans TaxID=1644129 RepID=UPI003D955363